MTVKLSFVISLLCLLGSIAFAQVSLTDSTLSAANRLYNAGSYETAELTARRLMEQVPLADSIRIEAERIIAFSLVAQGKSELAREHFQLILAINPSFRLDQILTSPKILTVFQEARLHSPEAQKANRGDDGGDLENLPITFRAVLFPGWEQYHRGQISKGVALGAAGVLTLGSAVTCEILRASARKDYVSATQSTDIVAKYKTYNRYYRGEVYSFIAFAVVYVASEFDVFLSPPKAVQIHSSEIPAGSSNLVFSLNF